MKIAAIENIKPHKKLGLITVARIRLITKLIIANVITDLTMISSLSIALCSPYRQYE